VLQSWNEPEYVSHTGLFHSVYGTELFQVIYPVIAHHVCCTAMSVVVSMVVTHAETNFHVRPCMLMLPDKG